MSIDPVEFGRVLARLDQQDINTETLKTEIKQEIAEMKRAHAEQTEKMQGSINELLALANRGKGALFTLTSIGAAVGAVLGALGHHFLGKG
jgi:hypothetical protein